MNKVNFIFNKENLNFNVEKLNKKNNIIYITGLSGSGKTTTAKALEKNYNAIVFELDNLGQFFGEYRDSKETIHSLTNNFLNANLQLKELLKSGQYMTLKLKHFEEYVMWNNKYIHFLEEYAHKHNEVFIFEGTHLFKCIEPQHFVDKPLIVIGTSAIISLIRRMKRQYKIDKERNKSHFFRKHFWKLLNDSKRLHIKDFFYLNRFLKEYENLIGYELK